VIYKHKKLVGYKKSSKKTWRLAGYKKLA